MYLPVPWLRDLGSVGVFHPTTSSSPPDRSLQNRVRRRQQWENELSCRRLNHTPIKIAFNQCWCLMKSALERLNKNKLPFIMIALQTSAPSCSKQISFKGGNIYILNSQLCSSSTCATRSQILRWWKYPNNVEFFNNPLFLFLFFLLTLFAQLRFVTRNFFNDNNNFMSLGFFSINFSSRKEVFRDFFWGSYYLFES